MTEARSLQFFQMVRERCGAYGMGLVQAAACHGVVAGADLLQDLVASRFGQRAQTSVAVLYENNTYGRGLADSFRRSFHGEIMSLDMAPLTGEETHADWLESQLDLISQVGVENYLAQQIHD